MNEDLAQIEQGSDQHTKLLQAKSRLKEKIKSIYSKISPVTKD